MYRCLDSNLINFYYSCFTISDIFKSIYTILWSPVSSVYFVYPYLAGTVEIVPRIEYIGILSVMYISGGTLLGGLSITFYNTPTFYSFILYIYPLTSPHFRISSVQSSHWFFPSLNYSTRSLSITFTVSSLFPILLKNIYSGITL